MEGKVIRGYKGFDKDLKCRGFQYEVGKEYECNKAVICEEGFHFCEHPLDVLGYYAPSKSRYCKVEASGEIKRSKTGDKVCCTKIKIVEEIGIDDLIKEGANLNLSNVGENNDEERFFVTSCKQRSEPVILKDYSKVRNEELSSGVINVGNKSFAINFLNFSVANNTGNCSVASNMAGYSVVNNTGNFSISNNSGHYSIAANTGIRSLARNKGCSSVAVSTGNASAANSEADVSVAVNAGSDSIATNTGDWSIAANIGYNSTTVNTGKRSVAVSIGNFSAVSVEGQNSVAIADGCGTVAKGALGCWIVLIEREGCHMVDSTIQNVKAFKVDGKIVKPDTFYKLVNGELVEVEQK